MQSPENISKTKQNYELLDLIRKRSPPLGVEGFIEHKESPVSPNVFKLRNPHRLATANDAEQIVKVNHAVYDGYYPYHDLLDVQYVRDFASDKNRGIIGVYELEDKIGGFLMFAVDREQRKGQYRGLMVIPSQRTKMQVKNRLMETAYQAYTRYYQDVDLWYGETRTAHKKGQSWMEECGSRPCALLPNKDIFTEDSVRESDVLEVVYTKTALYESRNPNPQLLPQFKPLFRQISQYYNFADSTIQETQFSFSSTFLGKAQAIADTCKYSKHSNKYNTHILTIRSAIGSTLEFLINDLIDSAEKATLNYTSKEELAGMMLYLKSIMEKEKLEYFEIYIPTTDVEIQQIMLDLNFSCFGYAPSWQKTDKILNDCLLFGLYRSPINWMNTRLAENSQKIVDTVKPFMNVF